MVILLTKSYEFQIRWRISSDTLNDKFHSKYYLRILKDDAYIIYPPLLFITCKVLSLTQIEFKKIVSVIQKVSSLSTEGKIFPLIFREFHCTSAENKQRLSILVLLANIRLGLSLLAVHVCVASVCKYREQTF